MQQITNDDNSTLLRQRIHEGRTYTSIKEITKIFNSREKIYLFILKGFYGYGCRPNSNIIVSHPKPIQQFHLTGNQ